jgi:hypothetical protein
VAFSAGSLLGGALLHLLPEAVAASGPGLGTFLPALGGFALFFLMEQFLSWHHGHSVDADTKAPVTYLILLADDLREIEEIGLRLLRCDLRFPRSDTRSYRGQIFELIQHLIYAVGRGD